ncbi:LysR family transcriptional regulator [Massilia sp. TS11]|uniref:LysR family transcriptional regulator n=1 Tax=Massilia sp. TS11 TaxID=2908003 RepID=UPI001EDC51E6|nr:LysR family transcriptional regulator [Massilia sp. TS11]MCG2585609.1 LysR family transcriptional regulator [Massilia sp. TS11]
MSSAHQWDDVRYFLALSHTQSLSAAARQLDVDHSTVARRVDAFEKALGLRLFDRLPRGWVLTAEGEKLAAQAARIGDEMQVLSRLALGVSSLQGTVRVSVPPVLASSFLVARLASMQDRWPHIDLVIFSESREANLARGEADMAIRMSRPSAMGLTARRIGMLGYGLYASPGYAQRPAAEWRFLGYEDGHLQVPHQQWLSEISAERRYVVRSNDPLVLLDAARAGLGAAVLPHFLAAREPGLAHIALPSAPPERAVWLVMHSGVRRSPRIRQVADLVAEAFDAARKELIGVTGRA